MGMRGNDTKRWLWIIGGGISAIFSGVAVFTEAYIPVVGGLAGLARIALFFGFIASVMAFSIGVMDKRGR